MGYIPKSAMRRIDKYQRMSRPVPLVTEPKPYQPGQLTPAQFAYLFRTVMEEEFNRVRATSKTWDAWETFYARWDAERREESDRMHFETVQRSQKKRRRRGPPNTRQLSSISVPA